MQTLRARRGVASLLVTLTLTHGAVARQQQGRPRAEDDGEEVVRVETQLAQADMTVVDKKGRFVDGLRPEQFEVRVGGRPQSLAFFERVAAGVLPMSSVFVGELKGAGVAADARRRVAVNVSRRFPRTSRLRYQADVYGAAPAALSGRVSVLRDGREVLGLPASGNSADPSRTQFSGEFPVAQLDAGRYVLRVSIADAQTGATATRETFFVVE